MEYRVEDLAAEAGVRVDTVRYYQGRGLLPAPERRGRVAWYGDAHLERLRRIRALLDEGLTLALIQRVLAREGREGGAPAVAPRDDSLLDALVETHVGERTYSRAELASAAGIPEPLLQAAQAAGLIEPIESGGQERFSEAHLAMARAGLAVLEGGFPLPELLGLAVQHARQTGETVERAIDLFDDHVRKREGGTPEQVTDAFRQLLPQATRLVALHFQRTLVTRALARLSESGASSDLANALAATEEGSLEVSVTWR